MLTWLLTDLENGCWWNTVRQQLVELRSNLQHPLRRLFLNDQIGHLDTVRFPVRLGDCQVG